MALLKDLFSSIKNIGGLQASFWQLLRVGALLPGKKVGTDYLGNDYYVAPNRIFGRDRFVMYKDYWNFEGSQIPPEWHRWIHHITDELPTKDTIKKQSWAIDHYPNLTETSRAYMPYSTTRPKIQEWDPNAKQ